MSETPTPNASLDDVSFEQAMQELETIVTQLEQGDLPLDQSLLHFERAVALSRASQKKLQQAEQKVSVLLRNERNGGAESLQPLPSNLEESNS